MKIGIDFYNVITQYPKQMRELARSFLVAGNEVYIISAYGDRQLKKYDSSPKKYKEFIESYNVPCSGIKLVYFKDDDSLIPKMKYDVIKRLGIELMIDDRPETIKYLHERGICALQMLKPIKKKDA